MLVKTVNKVRLFWQTLKQILTKISNCIFFEEFISRYVIQKRDQRFIKMYE